MKILSIIVVAFLVAFNSISLNAERSDKAVSTDNFQVDKLKEFININQKSVLELIAQMTGMDVTDLDPATLVIRSEGERFGATVTSRDGQKGFFLSPENKKVKQQAGLYVFENQSDRVYATFNGKKIKIQTLLPRGFFEVVDAAPQCPGFGCGCWADPGLANQCFVASVCAYTGVCFPN